MPRHKDLNLKKLEELPLEMRELAWHHGDDVHKWDQIFLSIIERGSHADFEPSDNSASEEARLRNFLRGMEISHSEVGQIICTKLEQKDTEFFELLLNFVRRKEPVEPLRCHFLGYQLRITLGLCPPPTSFHDILESIPKKLNSSSRCEKAIKRAAKDAGVWPIGH